MNQPRDVIYLAAELVSDEVHVIDALNAAAKENPRWSYCTPYLREQIPCKDLGEWAGRVTATDIKQALRRIADGMGVIRT